LVVHARDRMTERAGAAICRDRLVGETGTLFDN